MTACGKWHQHRYVHRRDFCQRVAHGCCYRSHVHQCHRGRNCLSLGLCRYQRSCCRCRPCFHQKERYDSHVDLLRIEKLLGRVYHGETNAQCALHLYRSITNALCVTFCLQTTIVPYLNAMRLDFNNTCRSDPPLVVSPYVHAIADLGHFWISHVRSQLIIYPTTRKLLVVFLDSREQTVGYNFNAR